MEDPYKVLEIKVLKRRPGAEDAMKMLEKIAKQVQPIMRKHKWRVKLLSEFCSNNLLGLNVNGGVNVKLRLRRFNQEWDFFPYDEVLDTMLHELCHNVHGPHNAAFYKLWDELRKECDELMSKGVTGTGEGFDLPGRRLGGFSLQPPLAALRKTALTAAENRAKMAVLMPSGPRRLGGDKTIKVALTPIQAAAMAAERRLHDDIWCGSHNPEVSENDENIPGVLDEALVGQHSESSKQNSLHTDLPLNTISQKRNHGFDNKLSSQTSRNSADCEANESKRRCNSGFVDLASSSSSGSVINLDATQNREIYGMWECEACTLLNPPLAPVCELCSNPKPRDTVEKYKTWSCKFCTLENIAQLDNCSACDQWRYSYGEPISMGAPKIGT